MRNFISSLAYLARSFFSSFQLSLLGKYIGSNRFADNSRCYRNVVVNNIELGKFSYINRGSHVSNALVGSFCSIGQDVKIGGLGAHKLGISTHPAFYSAAPPMARFHYDSNFESFKPITIGHDVWVGDRAIILDGVSVGTGAIIAAGCVVHKNVPPYAIVGGNPMRVIRYRFSDSEIDQLLRSLWWARPENELRKVASLVSTELAPSLFLKELDDTSKND